MATKTEARKKELKAQIDKLNEDLLKLTREYNRLINRGPMKLVHEHDHLYINEDNTEYHLKDLKEFGPSKDIPGAFIYIGKGPVYPHKTDRDIKLLVKDNEIIKMDLGIRFIWNELKCGYICDSWKCDQRHRFWSSIVSESDFEELVIDPNELRSNFDLDQLESNTEKLELNTEEVTNSDESTESKTFGSVTLFTMEELMEIGLAQLKPSVISEREMELINKETQERLKKANQ
jgi:hypothetical protein